MLQSRTRCKGAAYRSEAEVGHDPFVILRVRPAPRQEPADPALRAVKWLAVAVVGIAVSRTAWSLVAPYL